MPAEWETHAAVWMAWPAHTELWGAHLPAAQAVVRAIAKALAGVPGGERIEMLVRDARAEEEAARALEGLRHRLHRVPYGDIWLRDTAPLFRAGEGAGALAFRFNGWGGKYRLPGDEDVARAVAERAGVRLDRSPLVLEGGAVECDGAGTAITTRSCVLNENRNPGWDEPRVEAALAEALGVRSVIWLDAGLAGDHTDGHVDNLARFVAPGRVVVSWPRAGDPNAEVLRAVHTTLKEARDATGRRPEVVKVPSPGRVTTEEGIAPASYLNFFIGNRRVLVPTFGKESDAEALATLAALLPEREVQGIDARAILEGGGAIHCITQPQPGGPR